MLVNDSNQSTVTMDFTFWNDHVDSRFAVTVNITFLNIFGA